MQYSLRQEVLRLRTVRARCALLRRLWHAMRIVCLEVRSALEVICGHMPADPFVVHSIQMEKVSSSFDTAAREAHKIKEMEVSHRIRLH